MDDRQAMTAIFFILRTGIQWKALPRSLGAASTVHDRFQYWQEKGVFKRLWEAGLRAYDEAKGIEWTWQAVDGAMTKAPLGGKGTGPNPTDRGKSGTKRSLLTDGRGVPPGLAVDGANRHDMKMLEPTLNATVVGRPQPNTAEPQHLCLDKGYDYPVVRELASALEYVLHLRTRG